MRRALYTVVTLVAVTMLFAVGCKMQKKTTATEDTKKDVIAIPVSVTPVSQRDLQETVAITGNLKPANEVTVGPRFAAKVTWMVGKAGTPVHKGQVVIILDNTDAKIQVRTAEAAVEAAKARHDQTIAALKQQVSATDAGILNARAGVSAAKARLQQAQTTHDAQQATADAQVAQATQALNAAKSRLAQLQNGSRSQEKQIAENNVRLAEATYNNDARTYERYRGLNDQGAVSRSVLDTYETKMQVSKAQLDSARQQLDLVKTGARQEEIDTAKAAVDQAQAALDAAKAGLKQVDVASDNISIAATGVEQAKAMLATAEASANVDVMRDKDVQAAKQALQQARESVNTAKQMLSYMQVTSPVDGVVEEQIAEVGQALGANVAALRIATENTLFFEAQVSELDATRLQVQQPVKITVDALQGNRGNVFGQSTGHIILGTVERVVPVVDARSRNFLVRVIVRRNASLFPGMFARGQVVVARHPLTTAISKGALVEKDGGQFVFVAGDDNQAHQRKVVLGATDGDYVQVLSGVLVGDKVITNGQDTLHEGDTVKITGGAKASGK